MPPERRPARPQRQEEEVLRVTTLAALVAVFVAVLLVERLRGEAAG
jgi:hypothetical protein